MTTLTRPRSPNRPRRTRISTAHGHANVEGIGDLEVVRTERSGLARALQVAHGFVVGEVPEPAPPAVAGEPDDSAAESTAPQADLDPGLALASASLGQLQELLDGSSDEAVAAGLALERLRQGGARKGALLLYQRRLPGA